ncbi:MAG: hypothetical protein HUK07_04880 [Bacteroidaceae bacterium]|nr:hypothetical protein [Bacteroidaceae bacterium]
MNVNITDDELKDYITTGKSNGKYKKLSRDRKFSEKLVNIYTLMRSVPNTEALKMYSFLHYEKLRHQKEDNLSSVRIMNGRVERLLFNETDDGIEITIIELNETHYGNKK